MSQAKLFHLAFPQGILRYKSRCGRNTVVETLASVARVSSVSGKAKFSFGQKLYSFMFGNGLNLSDVGFGYVAVLHIDSDVLHLYSGGTHHHHLFSPTYHLGAKRQKFGTLLNHGSQLQVYPWKFFLSHRYYSRSKHLSVSSVCKQSVFPFIY